MAHSFQYSIRDAPLRLFGASYGNQMIDFQYSIRDAAVFIIYELDGRYIVFQYSIRDADIFSRYVLLDDGSLVPFNTLLEMHAGAEVEGIVVVKGRTFNTLLEMHMPCRHLCRIAGRRRLSILY